MVVQRFAFGIVGEAGGDGSGGERGEEELEVSLEGAVGCVVCVRWAVIPLVLQLEVTIGWGTMEYEEKRKEDD